MRVKRDNGGFTDTDYRSIDGSKTKAGIGRGGRQGRVNGNINGQRAASDSSVSRPYNE